MSDDTIKCDDCKQEATYHLCTEHACAPYRELGEARRERAEAVGLLRELAAEILALCPNHIDSLPCTECGDEDCIWTRAREFVAKYPPPAPEEGE